LIISFLSALLILAILASSHNKPSYIKLCNENKVKVIKEYVLSDVCSETSGLIYYQGLVWTFNDSGGDPELFSYSIKDSVMVQNIALWRAKNYDWEDITQDSSNIYVGDFGNNFGMRDNLCIYKVSKKDVPYRRNKLVNSSKISFTYPGYQHVLFSLKSSPWDCEAMVWFNDSLYLFSKNWSNKTSTIYSLPDKPGDYLARKIGTFNSEGLITAADYYNGTLYLLGYNNWTPFIWRFDKISNMNLRAEAGTRFDLKTLGGRQTEGIAILDSTTLVISAEKTSLPASLFVVKIL
jgi:hypothetical protein